MESLLTLIIRVVMVRFGLDAVITVGFGFLYFYIINIINTCLVASLQQVEDEGTAEVLGTRQQGGACLLQYLIFYVIC